MYLYILLISIQVARFGERAYHSGQCQIHVERRSTTVLLSVLLTPRTARSTTPQKKKKLQDDCADAHPLYKLLAQTVHCASSTTLYPLGAHPPEVPYASVPKANSLDSAARNHASLDSRPCVRYLQQQKIPHLPKQPARPSRSPPMIPHDSRSSFSRSQVRPSIPVATSSAKLSPTACHAVVCRAFVNSASVLATSPPASAPPNKRLSLSIHHWCERGSW